MISPHDPETGHLRAGAEEPDMSDAVTIAWCHSRTVESSWEACKSELLDYDLVNHQRIYRGGYISMTPETDGLAMARNKVVKEFLEKREAHWLMWFDTDMGFHADVVDCLMESADSEKRPIMGALAFSYRQDRPDNMGGYRCLATPTIFDWGTNEEGTEEGFIVRFDYLADTIQQCGGTGSACILIHRRVFEAVKEKFGEHWYSRTFNPKMERLISEDLSFCIRAGMVGFPVFVDTSVKTTHAKTIYLQEEDYIAQRVLAALVPEVPPATEPTAVIVPVLGRPQNAKPFMESLVAAGPYAVEATPTVYVVVDDDENPEVLDAWVEAGAEPLIFDAHPIPGPAGTFAEKVNYAYTQTIEPWLFLTGDDVKFHPGWLDQAQHAARDGAHVIGTNDLKNPRVIRGEHATHLLIRRNYIDERGASWDGPGKVCHEYGHWYVDDEIVTVAKQRKVWAFAQHSKVEHFHPLWGDGEMDETYELGKSRAPADKEVFEKRVAEYAAA